MRRARIVVVAGAGVLVLLAAAVWMVPGLMDWSRYRDTIAGLAAARLGRPVRIGGAVTLQLLPQPSLTAADVTVEGAGAPDGGVQGGDGLVLRAKALRLRVALGPLLGGHVDTRELTLQGADVRLPWPPQPGALAQRPPSWITALRARIEDGRLQVGDVAFTGIEATLTSDADTGTLSVAGTGQSGVRSWQFTARLTRPGRDGSAGLDVSLDGQDGLRDTGGTFSGQIAADGTLTGRVAGRGPDLSLLLPAPAIPWRGDGRLSAAAGLAVADELALEIGGAPARGAVALRVEPAARLDLAIAAGRLDLDRWLPALLGGDAALGGGLPMGVDVSAEAATLGGGTLRRLRGALDVGAAGLQLRDVEAILPGEAKLALSGQVARLGQRFEGNVHVAAPDMRATLRWAERAVPQAAAVPPGVLRSADLSGHVTLASGLVQVDGISGTVDGSATSGNVLVKPGARPVVTAALATEQVQLAAWLPARLLTLDAFPGTLDALRGADLDVRLQVRSASWEALPLGAVAVELQSEASRVFLRRLEAQPGGARLTGSGQAGPGGRISDGRLELAAPDLRALRARLGEARTGLPWVADALLRGQGSALLTFAGPLDALATRLTMDAGDLHLEAQPVLNLVARRWAGPVLLHHPGAPRLLEALGAGATAAWLGDGSLSLVGQVSASPGRVELEGGTLAAGALRTGLRLVLDGQSVTGTVTAETLPLPLPYARSPDPLPLEWLRQGQVALRIDAAQVLGDQVPLLQNVGLDLALSRGTLRLLRVSGKAAGGTFAGSATLEAGQDPPRLTVDAQATGLEAGGAVFGTPLDVLAGSFDATAAFSAGGHSPAALLATLDGRAFVRGRDGVVAGVDLEAAARALGLSDAQAATASARGALSSGTTAFTNVEAPVTLRRGVASTEARFTGPTGQATLAGTLDLAGGGIDARIDLSPPLPDAPPLRMRVSGQASAPVRTPELSRLALWLAERAQ